MADAGTLLAALFDLSGAIHESRNSATFLTHEKMQLGSAFDRITTRSTLVKLHQTRVDAAQQADLVAAQNQVDKSRDLLLGAVHKSERRNAIAETFEVFDLVDVLLPESAHPFLF